MTTAGEMFDAMLRAIESARLRHRDGHAVDGDAGLLALGDRIDREVQAVEREMLGVAFGREPRGVA